MSPSLYMQYKACAKKLHRVMYRLLSDACRLLLDSLVFLPRHERLRPAISAIRHAVVELLSNIPKLLCSAVRDPAHRRQFRPTPQTAAKLRGIRGAAMGLDIPETGHDPHWIRLPRTRNFSARSRGRTLGRVSVEKSNVLARCASSSLYRVWIDPSFPEWRTACFSALVRCCRAVYLIETGRRNLVIARKLPRKLAEKLAESGLPRGETLFREGELPVSDQM